MAVRGECRSGNAPLVDDLERALDMLPDGRALTCIRSLAVEKRDPCFEDVGITRSDEILRKCHEWPEDDVAVRVASANSALPLEEHEPLWPVSVGILIGHDTQ